MQIRIAKKGDSSDVFSVICRSLKDGFIENSVVEAIDSDNSLVYVSEDQSGIDGFVISYFAADEAELLQIAVAPEARKRGVATGLIRELKKGLLEKEIKTLFLEVRDSNTAARKCYEKFGMVPCGKRPRFYKDPVEDAIIYRMDIADA